MGSLKTRSREDDYLPGNYINRSASCGVELEAGNSPRSPPQARSSVETSSPSLRSSLHSPYKPSANNFTNTVSFAANFTRAGRILSSVLLVFIITWLPYNILVIVKATCNGNEDCVPSIAWKISYY